MISVFVRALGPDGKWTTIDVLDLSERSFRQFVLERLCLVGAVHAVVDEMKEPEPLRHKECPL